MKVFRVCSGAMGNGGIHRIVIADSPDEAMALVTGFVITPDEAAEMLCAPVVVTDGCVWSVGVAPRPPP
jgi:hypothetical protein